MSPEKYDQAMHSSDSTFLNGLPAATDAAMGRLVASIRETSSKPIVLVDVGCGTGTEEKRMAEAGVFDFIERVIGVDFNPLFVEEATRINTSDKVSYVCGDACELEKGKIICFVIVLFLTSFPKTDAFPFPLFLCFFFFASSCRTHNFYLLSST